MPVGDVRTCVCGRNFVARRVRHLWCSERCQQRAYNRARRSGLTRVVEEVRCDWCAAYPAVRNPIRRFSLMSRTRHADGSQQNRGVGTILLCHRCWRVTAGRRRRWISPRALSTQEYTG